MEIIGPASMVSDEEVFAAAEIIKKGGIVAFPTETFYGLATDPFNPEALRRLFSLKGRTLDKPVLTLIDGPQSLSSLARDIPKVYEPLIKIFWPGPLTLIFEGGSQLPELLTDSLGTVGVRWSSHPLASRLAAAAGGVITGTSANPSGQPAAVSAGQAKELFPVGLDHVLDGGSTPGGLGSTIVSLRGDKLFPVREGVVSFSSIIAAAETDS